jgi:hypothetical protein
MYKVRIFIGETGLFISIYHRNFPNYVTGYASLILSSLINKVGATIFCVESNLKSY